MFVFAYSLAATLVIFFAQLLGCRPDSMIAKVLWFLAGYYFHPYIQKVVFPFLDERYP